MTFRLSSRHSALPATFAAVLSVLVVLSLRASAADAQARTTVNPANREGFVTTADGVRLHYRVYGIGTPVVIVPGALFLERDFKHLAQSRTIVFYDMRGRGQSDADVDSARVSIDIDVIDLEAVRQMTGAETFIPIGWSYLGTMVMRYLAKYPTRVERVVQIGPVSRVFRTPYPDSLVAHDATPIVDSLASKELLRLREAGMAVREPQAYCQLEYLATRALLVGQPRNAERVPDQCAMPNEWPLTVQRHQRWIFTSFAIAEAPSWEMFASLQTPLLTIHGTQDRNAPYGGGREWASRLPMGKLLTLNGAGHMAWLDEPRRLFDAVNQFLEGRWPAEARQPAR